MELLTINKIIPRYNKFDLKEPYILLNELKQMVKDLKNKNPLLQNYKLKDVGFPFDKEQQLSFVRLYFVKKS